MRNSVRGSLEDSLGTPLSFLAVFPGFLVGMAEFNDIEFHSDGGGRGGDTVFSKCLRRRPKSLG